MDLTVNSKAQEKTKAFQQEKLPLFSGESVKILEWHRKRQDKDTTFLTTAFQFSNRNKNKYLHT